MSGRTNANIYLRGKTYWGRLQIAGREHRSSLRTTDTREARRRLRHWKTELEREAVTGDSDQLFEEAVIRWITEVLETSVKPQTMRRYTISICSLEGTFKGVRVRDITTRLISNFVSGRSGNVTNATIRRDLAALSRLLSACVAWGWITANPALSFDRTIIRERRDPITPPCPDSVARVKTACPPGMAAILDLLEQTGMRENEAVSLMAENVDHERHQIRLIRTKTSRPRTIAWATPGGNAATLLEHAPRSGLLFPNRDGTAYRNAASNYGQVMRRVAARCEAESIPFTRFRIHDLRHAFAIRWLKAGGDIYRLSRHLGHTSVKTTEIYLSALTADELDRVLHVGTKDGTETP
ncbi:tyrosine-type recombinase/integrase [Komagataeibacter nataicola]|uniref:tyrosine-type recombinase/integrase n=1 Tax=Komagataeibacter nataicola TaxID=265960 RepID=UPI0023DD3966|nr:site-specific integrase [Komagataeibacter nataicola]WEQ56302.1 tyrosine-type recombinase/integrase [Komagataeibacter nataicola]